MSSLSLKIQRDAAEMHIRQQYQEVLDAPSAFAEQNQPNKRLKTGERLSPLNSSCFLSTFLITSFLSEKEAACASLVTQCFNHLNSRRARDYFSEIRQEIKQLACLIRGALTQEERVIAEELLTQLENEIPPMLENVVSSKEAVQLINEHFKKVEVFLKETLSSIFNQLSLIFQKKNNRDFRESAPSSLINMMKTLKRFPHASRISPLVKKEIQEVVYPWVKHYIETFTNPERRDFEELNLEIIHLISNREGCDDRGRFLFELRPHLTAQYGEIERVQKVINAVLPHEELDDIYELFLNTDTGTVYCIIEDITRLLLKMRDPYLEKMAEKIARFTVYLKRNIKEAEYSAIISLLNAMKSSDEKERLVCQVIQRINLDNCPYLSAGSIEDRIFTHFVSQLVSKAIYELSCEKIERLTSRFSFHQGMINQYQHLAELIRAKMRFYKEEYQKTRDMEQWGLYKTTNELLKLHEDRFFPKYIRQKDISLIRAIFDAIPLDQPITYRLLDLFTLHCDEKILLHPDLLPVVKRVIDHIFFRENNTRLSLNELNWANNIASKIEPFH